MTTQSTAAYDGDRDPVDGLAPHRFSRARSTKRSATPPSTLDAAALEAVAVDVDDEELQDRRCRRGERAVPDRRGLATSATHHVGDPVLRMGAFVVVVVPGEDQVDTMAGEDRFESPTRTDGLEPCSPEEYSG